MLTKGVRHGADFPGIAASISTLQLIYHHLLQHPPVQGKAALGRIIKDISSENFPDTTDEAIELLQHGPLARARLALVGSVIKVLLKELLQGKHPAIQNHRYLAVLNAILKMYAGTAEEILRENLPKYIREGENISWLMVLTLLHHVSEAWIALGEAERLQARHFITTCSLDVSQPDYSALGHALYVPAFHQEH